MDNAWKERVEDAVTEGLYSAVKKTRIILPAKFINKAIDEITKKVMESEDY